jgi:hypothetical protein
LVDFGVQDLHNLILLFTVDVHQREGGVGFDSG